MIYDGDDVLMRFEGTGTTPTAKDLYLLGPAVDQVFADDHLDGTVIWPLVDHQGSTRDLINSAGDLLAHLSYDAFGNLNLQGLRVYGPANYAYTYTGREFDGDTGLLYYRSRYYDPSVSRFLSEDTLGFSAGDPNLYRYTGNDPVNRVDPSGNSWLSAALGVATDIFVDMAGAGGSVASLSGAGSGGALGAIGSFLAGPIGTALGVGGLLVGAGFGIKDILDHNGHDSSPSANTAGVQTGATGNVFTMLMGSATTTQSTHGFPGADNPLSPFYAGSTGLDAAIQQIDALKAQDEQRKSLAAHRYLEQKNLELQKAWLQEAIDEQEAAPTRFWGLVNMGLSGAEVVGGIAAIAASGGWGTLLGGGAAVAHGADGFIAAFNQIWSGEQTSTTLEKIVGQAVPNERLKAMTLLVIDVSIPGPGPNELKAIGRATGALDAASDVRAVSRVDAAAPELKMASSGLTRLGQPGRLIFEGMEVRAVRDLSHLDEGTLRAMQARGFAATDINGQPLQLHHLVQNPSGPLVEIPAPRHGIHNQVQHPFGNQPGAGLTPAQREAFNDWRERYWKERAAEELMRRGLQ